MESSVTSPLIIVTEVDQIHAAESTKGRWRASICLNGVQVFERFAMYGMSGNLITYLTDVLHEPTATAAANINAWIGVTTLLPILGAFVADAYLGGFTTILLSFIIYVTGLVMLTLSVSMVPPEFRHVLFFISLYLVSIGEGGQRPCLQTFGAHQFVDNNPEERKGKGTFFNWWFFGACVGGSAGILVFYVQDNVGWVWGFTIPTLAMVFALVIFLLGTKIYRKHVPSGSPVTQVMQVFVAAYRKRHISDSEGAHIVFDFSPKDGTLPRTNQFKCLDKGTIIDDIDVPSQSRNSWRLCSVNQVEEVKLLLHLVPIWLSCLMFAVVSAQGATFFTKQGSKMDTSITPNFHVSPASFQITINLTVILFLPIYDRVFIPLLRRFTGLPSGITTLQRIGSGMFLATIEMVVAALVESRRLNIANKLGNTTLPLSIWWLLPQYILAGAASIFTIVGLQQLFYDQMPDSMRTLGSASYLSAIACGSFLSSVVISLVQYVSSWTGDKWLVDDLDCAHLDYFYWLLAGLNSFALVVFIVVANRFVYKKNLW